jgi:hypothetical protein
MLTLKVVIVVVVVVFCFFGGVSFR